MSTTTTSPLSTPDPAMTTAPRNASVGLAFLPIILRIGLLLGAAVILMSRDASTVYLNAIIIGVDLITIAAVIAVARRSGVTLGALFGRFRALDLLWGLLLAVVLMMVMYGTNAVLYAVGLMPEASSTLPFVPLWLGLSSLLIMPITIAVAEELAYRGFVQQVMTQKFGAVLAILLIAVVFGLQHIVFTDFTGVAMLARVLPTFFAGLVFGVAVWRLRGRLTAAIVAHWIIDVIGLGLPMLFLAMPPVA